MAFRLNTALRNFIQQGGSFKAAFQNGKMELRTGTQPDVSAIDNAASGTLLNTITASSGTHTAETLASTTITLSGGSGSVDDITVDSVSIMAPAYRGATPTVVSFTTDLTTTAAAVAAVINDGTWWHGFTATSASAVITLKATPGKGAALNGKAVAFTGTTLSGTVANTGTLAGGVNPANGLDFGTASAGVISKGNTWSGLAVATGTAGYGRIYSSDGTMWMDGNVATSGANINLTSTTITQNTTTTIDSAALTMPAA